MKGFMTIVSICVALMMSAANTRASDRRIAIATAGTAGALYPMGVAIAEVISRHVEGFKSTAEASSASLENVRNLANGNVEWGISQNEVAFLAYHGKDVYKNRPVKTLRSLFGTLISWAQIFAPADSPINSVKDFKGKRIGVGAPGSGGERVAHKILCFYGLDYKQVKAGFMSNPEMVGALKDGVLDAFIITHPLKSAALLDLTATFKVKMIPVTDEEFYKKYPYFTKREISAGTYKNVDTPITTPTSRVVMYTSTKADFSTDDMYRLLKGMWENADQWINTHAAVKKYTTLDAAVKGLNVPLHPGAVKYYKEKGLTIPLHLIQ